MSLADIRQKLTPWHFALAAAVALALVARFLPGERTIDDAFITFRYARNLLEGGVSVISEGANMPIHADGVKILLDAKILYGPGKAANAGGVAVSGLEMSQNSMRMAWTREEVDAKLHSIMKSIHSASMKTAEAYGTPGNYVNGANIAGFIKVADAMMDQGLV